MAETKSNIVITKMAREAFLRDMRLLADQANISLDGHDEIVEDSFHRFIDLNSALLETHSVEAVAGVGFVDVSQLNTKPIAAQMGEFQVVKGEDRTIYTNRHIVDLSATEPHFEGWVGESKASTAKITAKQINDLTEQQWFHKNVTIEMRMLTENGGSLLALSIPGNDKVVLVKEEYLSYFCTKTDDMSLNSNAAQTMVSVIENDKLVGIIGTTPTPEGALNLKVHIKSVIASKKVVFADLANEITAAKAKVASQVEIAPQARETPAPEVGQVQDWRSAIPDADTTPDVEPLPDGFVPQPAWQGTRPVVTISNAGLPRPAQEAEVRHSFDALNPDDGADEIPELDAQLTSDQLESEVEMQLSTAPKEPEEAPSSEEVAEQPQLSANASEPATQAEADKVTNEPRTGTQPQLAATFELGEPICAPYASVEVYKALLEERLAKAVSQQHEMKIIEQEVLNLGHNQDVAVQQSNYYNDMLKRFEHREVDGTAYILGKLFEDCAHIWFRQRHPLPQQRERAELNLENLEATVDALPKRSPQTPAATANGGAGTFRRESAVAALNQVDASLDEMTSSTTDGHAFEHEVDVQTVAVADENFTELQKYDPVLGASKNAVSHRDMNFVGDPAYLASKTSQVFDKMRPEHLINRNDEVDQNWIDTVKLKLSSITEKLSLADIAEDLREMISAIIDNISATFTALVDAAKKLFTKDNEKSVGGGRIEPSFVGLDH